MSLILTVIVPTVRVRRGPGESAAIVAQAKTGDQYPVINLIDKAGREQWAKIVFPERENEDLYICVRMANGNTLCTVSNTPSAPDSNDEYKRAKRDVVEKLIQTLRQELDAL